ncbi:MAG: Allergen V5/Tpx family protein [Variovorax sp.]|nr:Allergen V5/Tpx family protein [Variovorax sp.]
MKQYFKNKTPWFAIVTLALAGCGGGGSDGTSFAAFPVSSAATPQTQSQPGSAPANGDSSLALSVPTPTYAANSEEIAAFTLLNAERSRCGFGLLAQNVLLDTAAYGHANYLLKNNETGHFQDPSRPSFTGKEPGDRLLAAGYTWSVVLDDNTDTRGPGANNLAGRGQAAIRGLLSAPYHALSLLAFEHDIGMSILSSDAAGSTALYGPRAIAQFDIASALNATAQRPDSAFIQTYPCEGTTGTAYKLTNETPNPLPGRNLAVQPVGQPIMIAVRPGRTLTLSSATMAVKATGAPVALLPALTSGRDTTGLIDANQAAIIPADALAPETEYTVVINGTSSPGSPAGGAGVDFTKTFSFRTGS